MKTQPISNQVSSKGRIHVTAVKNETWRWYDYITSKNADKKIKNMANKILPKDYNYTRETLSEKNGKKFRNLLEKTIGTKLEIPENPTYSSKVSKYNNRTSILFFCEEKCKLMKGDRTAVDIYI